MVFPIGDDNSDRKIFPVVTIVLIAINAIMFVIPQGMGTNDAFTMAFSTVPAEIVSGKDLVTEDKIIQQELPDGSVVRGKQPGLEPTPISVYLTLLTSMFMHGGWAHILGNMWFLWIFGDNIEEDLGHWRYVAFYLLCGLLASLAHVFVSAWGDSAQIPSLGASGAISGVMGAYLVLHPRRRVTVLLFRVMTQVPGYVAVGIWFVFQIIASLPMLSGMPSGGVAYAAHIGGFIAGAALARPFVIGRPVREAYQARDENASPRQRGYF
jgi:membrane associated rhomboid family serine protease